MVARGAKVEVVCAYKRCRIKFMARVADRKRGWARFCSKSCKAAEQENRTHQNANHAHRELVDDDGFGPLVDDNDFGHIFESGYFGHGQE